VSFVEERFPEWTKRASCAGRTTADWFSDDVADPGLRREPVFPDSVYVALKVCSSCPVKRECIELAYDTAKPQSWGWANVYTDPETSSYQELTIEPMHAGIFGVPAMIRERMDGPNRVDRCLEWLATVSRTRHWALPTSASSEEQTA
jgi:hypothetical protein